MKRLEDLLVVLRTVSIADISQAPREEQHLLAENLEELEDRLKTIFRAATAQILSPKMKEFPSLSKFVYLYKANKIVLTGIAPLK